MRLVLVTVAFLLTSACGAHEMRPAYLKLIEERPGEFHALWKTPMRGEMRLALMPGFSGVIQNLTPMAMREADDASIQMWRFRAVEPLRGQTIEIGGLNGTMTDALVQIEFADGSAWTRRFTPHEPAGVIPAHTSRWAMSRTYLGLGIGHIFVRVEPLLFLVALLLLTRGAIPLIKTVTAFTAAQSITLVLATLGFVHVPSRPVEAVIALSIVFVAREIVLARRGTGNLASDTPWLIAFAIGLLHGFGAAGALTVADLPQQAVPIALLFFNVGVAAGLLLFVATAVGVLAAIRRVPLQWPRRAGQLVPYAVGGVAMCWVMQRVAAF